MKKRGKKQVKTGASRMAELGNLQVQVWIPCDEAVALRYVAKERGQPIATYCREAICKAVCEDPTCPTLDLVARIKDDMKPKKVDSIERKQPKKKGGSK